MQPETAKNMTSFTEINEVASANVLVMDEEKSVRDLLGRLLETRGHRCSLAASMREAAALLKNESFDLILCDVYMPGESGIEFIRHLNSVFPDTSVIIVSGFDDEDTVKQALQVGVYGYVVKPVRPNELLINVANALLRRKFETERREHEHHLQDLIQERTQELQETLQNYKAGVKGVIRALAATLETRDPYTAGHQKRVAVLAAAIARKINVPEYTIEGLQLAAEIHDIGKTAVPSEILSKPGMLNEYEFGLIRLHSEVGYHILQDIEFPWPIAKIVYQHHERLDGSGYPQGLSGDNILLEAKIIAVADIVEAMTSHRPHRPALGLDAALAELSNKKGVLYDEAVADACLNLLMENAALPEDQISSFGNLCDHDRQEMLLLER